jgi:hypothetical protein
MRLYATIKNGLRLLPFDLCCYAIHSIMGGILQVPQLHPVSCNGTTLVSFLCLDSSTIQVIFLSHFLSQLYSAFTLLY